MKSNYPLSRKEDIVIQEADGEVLIYDLKDNKAYCLNETSALIWQMCDGNKSVGEISEGVAKKLNSPANEDLVWLALDQLKKEKLIANGEELESKFEGMSRREVIKKVGLSTMLALPVIVGLTTPAAAQSASNCITTTACTCTNSNRTANGGNGVCVSAVCGGGGQPCRCRNLGADDSGGAGLAAGNCALP